MRLLIAYDGSTCADAALDDLRRAGLARELDATVLSVADAWLPPGEAEAPLSPPPTIFDEIYAHSLAALGDARQLAARGADRLRRLFPVWRVQAEGVADSPAWAIVKKAESWAADLVVVGSHGRGALGRALFGSVSHKLLGELRRSVRLGRASERAPTRPCNSSSASTAPPTRCTRRRRQRRGPGPPAALCSSSRSSIRAC